MPRFLKLDNVEETARLNPDSFFIPSREERISQAVGASVRLHFMIADPPEAGPQAERMWVTVTQAYSDTGAYKGTLQNTPAVIEDLQPGAEIEFRPWHIAQTTIKRGDPRWIDSANRKALVSEMCFEPDAVIRFIYREEPDNEQDSGWRMFTGLETPEYNDDPNNIRMPQVGYMLDRDPTLLKPLKIGTTGSVFERRDRDSAWEVVEDWEPGDEGTI